MAIASLSFTTLVGLLLISLAIPGSRTQARQLDAEEGTTMPTKTVIITVESVVSGAADEEPRLRMSTEKYNYPSNNDIFTVMTENDIDELSKHCGNKGVPCIRYVWDDTCCHGLRCKSTGWWNPAGICGLK